MVRSNSSPESEGEYESDAHQPHAGPSRLGFPDGFNENSDSEADSDCRSVVSEGPAYPWENMLCFIPKWMPEKVADQIKIRLGVCNARDIPNPKHADIIFVPHGMSDDQAEEIERIKPPRAMLANVDWLARVYFTNTAQAVPDTPLFVGDDGQSLLVAVADLGDQDLRTKVCYYLEIYGAIVVHPSQADTVVLPDGHPYLTKPSEPYRSLRRQDVEWVFDTVAQARAHRRRVTRARKGSEKVFPRQVTAQTRQTEVLAGSGDEDFAPVPQIDASPRRTRAQTAHRIESTPRQARAQGAHHTQSTPRRTRARSAAPAESTTRRTRAQSTAQAGSASRRTREQNAQQIEVSPVSTRRTRRQNSRQNGVAAEEAEEEGSQESEDEAPGVEDETESPPPADRPPNEEAARTRKRARTSYATPSRTRGNFTSEDRDWLARWLAYNRPLNEGRLSQALYNRLASYSANHRVYGWAAAHTPSAWREHYKRTRAKRWRDGTVLDKMIEEYVQRGMTHDLQSERRSKRARVASEDEGDGQEGDGDEDGEEAAEDRSVESEKVDEDGSDGGESGATEGDGGESGDDAEHGHQYDYLNDSPDALAVAQQL